MDLIRHDQFMSWGAACSVVVAVCFLQACKQPSSSDLTEVTGGSQTAAATTVTTTTVPTPVVVNGPIGNSALAFTPQSFAFGTLVQNSGSATKTFIVTNTSTYTLVLGAITGTDANFTVTANICLPGFSMAPSVSCTFTVQFAPTVSGSLSAAITIPYAVSTSQNIFSSLLSVTGAGTSLVGFAGLATIDNQTPTAMRLNWTDVAGASTYQVYNTDSGTPVLLASVISANLVSGIGCAAGSCSYTATGLLPSTSHSYRVAASDFLGVQSINTHDVTSQTTADFLDINGAASASAGACTPLTIALTQADHTTAETVAANTAIAISGLGNGTIYSDNACGILVASPVVIASGNSSTTFYFKDNAAESLTLSATRSQFSSTTKAFTVNPLVAIASVAYVAAPGAAYAASNSAPMTAFTVAIKDSFGNVITTDSTATVTLSVASGGSALGGTLTKTVFHGVATFSDITYSKSETITIQATENTSGNGYNVTSSSVTVNPAAIASVAWLTPPVATRTASSTPMPTFTAALKDALGNVVTSDNSSTITLTRTGTGALGGTLTKTVSSGVATFDDVVYTKAESVTLTVTESSANHYFVTKDTAVSPAAFSLSQSLLSSAASVNSGSSITVTLAAKDAFGNAGPSGITAVSLTSSLVGGTGTYGSVTNAGSGVYTAAFTGVIAGSVTLGATINGGTVTSAPVTITVNPSPTIASVAFVAAPPATYTASTTAPMTTFTAAIKDANGNVITSNSTAHITVLGVGGTTLGGTLTKTVSSGVATFDDITYTKAETIQIKATEDASGTNLNVTSGSITVNPSPVIASVAFVAAPPATYTASNTTPMTAFTAAIKDPFGNIITTNSTSQLHLGLSLGSGSLGATVYVSVSNGIATFSDVTYTKPETIRLTVDLGSLSVTSSDITVTARLAFTTQPSSSGDTDTALPQQPVVAVQDGAGATASGATNSITLTAYSDSACTVPVASAFTAATNPLSATSGVAAFSGIKILKTNVVRIGASATGITSACSSAVAIAAGAVHLAQSSVTWFPASLIADNSATSAITVTLKDANGNAIPGKTVTATSDRGADTISGSGGSTNSSGVVNLTVKSSSTGSSAITVVGNGTAMNPTVQVQFLSATPLTDYQSRLFNGVRSGDNSSSLKSIWKDLSRAATTYDGSLINFLFDATSGWSGAPPRSYSEEVLADNPVGYWRLGESSGTTANDISGNAINGTYTNVTLAQAGALAGDSDTAVSFNGTSSIVDLGQGATLKGVFDSGKKWTVSMWFKTAQLNGNGPWLLSKAFTSHTSPYYQFDIRQGGDGSIRAAIWRSDTYTGQNVSVSSPAIPTGVWTHLAVTVDITNLSAVTIALYINGGTPLTSTAELPGGIYTNFDSPVTLGANKNLTPGVYSFDGLIDDVAIFPSALSAARILAHYNAGVHSDAPLLFDGATSNSYVDFGTGVNGNTNFSFETWIKPANTAATGKVILSNGQTLNPGATQTDTGLTLRQSKIYPGKLDLFLGESGEASYTQEVLSDTPAGYWRLNESSGSGGVATNLGSCGGSCNGTYTLSGVTYGVSGALSGDTDKGITLNNAASVGVPINIATTVTVEAWGKNADFTSNYRLLWRMGAGAWVQPYTINLAFFNGRIFLNQGDGEGNPFCNYPASATDGNFHHYVTVLNGSNSTAVLYYDGALCGSATYRDPTTSIFTISEGASTYEWIGSIDEVAIYNTALSASRILTHYNAALMKNTCTSTSTFANSVWRFISGVFDSTGPTLKLFVDGTQECSVTNAGTAYTGSANPLRLGRDSGAGNSWAGQVADLRTYGSALTAANVNTNALATIDRFPFSPKDIPGLNLWLKADTVALSDANPVAIWKDSSGHVDTLGKTSDATQSTASRQPLYKVNRINGKPAVVFDGVDDYLSLPFLVPSGNGLSSDLATDPDIARPYPNGSIFFVVKQSSDGNEYWSVTNSGGWPELRLWSNGSLSIYAQSAYRAGASFTVPSGFTLIEVLFSSSTLSAYQNGVTKVQDQAIGATLEDTAPSQHQLGGYTLSGRYSNAEISEVLMFNRPVSPTERHSIENYLNAKYGLY